MAQATSKTREAYPLSERKIIKKTIGAIIGWTTLYLLIIGFLFITIRSSGGGLDGMPTTVALVSGIVLVGIIILTYLYNIWYFNVYFYDLTQDFIIIRKGPITPREITIPYERVQDVYVDQDLFDRLFGLYDVHLSSATISSGMEAHIDGVEQQAADGLKAALLTTVKQKITRAGAWQPEVPKPPAGV